MHKNNHTRAGLLAVAATLVALGLGAGRAEAYPTYDDGHGVGCVNCHNGFQSVGALHNSHVQNFSITTGGPITNRCNVCHSRGGGTTPVYTMGSNSGSTPPYSGATWGCVGCHGQDYGETAGTVMGPSEAGVYAGKPKASGYGLRLVHAAAGVTVCAGCHPANPNPVLDETHNPPYYPMHISDLRNACDSAQEDLPYDVDSVGLDNDGNGFADYPNDPNCPLPTTTTSTTTTTTTTLPVACGVSPLPSCEGSAKMKLSINEKSAGKEKIKFLVSGLTNAVVKADWGSPVLSDTSYALCVYNGSNVLAGAYEVSRGSDLCSGVPCWADFKDAGFAYGDKTLMDADGISKIQLAGGDAGKGKILMLGKNSTSNLPTGVASALSGSTSAIAQFITSDGGCYGGTLSTVKSADGLVFSASAP